MPRKKVDPIALEQISAGDQMLVDLGATVMAAIGADETDYASKQAERYAAELARRDMDALKLYEPSEIQERYHSCTAKECMFQAGNQVGKSLAGFAEIARAVLGLDPYDKYPKKDGICAVLGYKEKHIGMVVHRYLFLPGAFSIIRDEHTKKWRTYRPWVATDKLREKQSIPAPPLIPKRYIKRIAWESKAKNIFSRVELSTGWVIHAFSSTAKPDQGFQLDLGHIDEDIIREDWYDELVGRCSMRNGKIRWTALPQNENDAMNRVAERAEDDEAAHALGGDPPNTVMVRATIFDNPFMSDEAREANIKIWKSKGEDEYRKRALGERITDTVRMYPTFSRTNNAIQAYNDRIGPLIDYYLDTKMVPPEWMRTMVVDPGHATCAVLFLATPPPEIGMFVLAYNELYIRQCDAKKFGESVHMVIGPDWFQRFIIDEHGGSLTSMDTGRTPQEAYESALASHNIQCVETGHRFVRGCDSISFRESETRLRLNNTTAGYPSILYDSDRCPNLEREMVRFKKKKINGEIIDKGNRTGNTHLVECLEYAMADGLEYIPPPAKAKLLTPAQLMVQSFKKRQSERAAKLRGAMSGSHVLLGPRGVR